MAHVSIHLNSEVSDYGKPLEQALQLLAEAVEGFYGYILGDPAKNEQNYLAMLWAVNHMSGLIAAERPAYEFGYSYAQDAELMELVDETPYPPHTSNVD